MTDEFPKCVLLVDDDRPTRKAVARTVKASENVVCIEADDNQQAWNAIYDHHPSES